MKKDKAVVVRISPQARKRIKVKATQLEMSIISYVEELSRLDLSTPLKK